MGRNTGFPWSDSFFMEILATYILAVAFIFTLFMWLRDHSLMDQERRSAAEERRDLISHYEKVSRDLMDRIQAPSFESYKEHVVDEPQEPEEPETEVDLEDAKEEILDG